MKGEWSIKSKYLIMEGFCNERKGRNFPCSNTFQMKAYCFHCPEFSYARSENELALSGADGTVERIEDWIGYGGDMEPDNLESYEEWAEIWTDICKRKIQEAKAEYIAAITRNRRCEG